MKQLVASFLFHYFRLDEWEMLPVNYGMPADLEWRNPIHNAVMTTFGIVVFWQGRGNITLEEGMVR
ncbi:hypothetical protein HAV15_012820 [Penicillium sp. str. |uniref:Str. FM013 n=1 Tax=Penicillium camemberti (strain FM 013) TaxID=1429867 RepID=A0A0G4P7E3_PENC3|nr:hypothetical protein HAV15_012820 [Penicillium sp. str. \